MKKSKQQEAKELQNFRPKGSFCSNCKNLRLEIEENESGFLIEKNIRCGIGGFAVKKLSDCDLWESL